MSRKLLSLIAVAVSAACSGGVPSGSDREAAVAKLQKEAEGLKRDGEQMNPSLGVKATWTITAVDVKDQPDNPAKPLLGTIKFRINSQMRDPTGPTEHNFERSFRYEYDAGMKMWLMKEMAPQR